MTKRDFESEKKKLRECFAPSSGCEYRRSASSEVSAGVTKQTSDFMKNLNCRCVRDTAASNYLIPDSLKKLKYVNKVACFAKLKFRENYKTTLKLIRIWYLKLDPKRGPRSNGKFRRSRIGNFQAIGFDWSMSGARRGQI